MKFETILEKLQKATNDIARVTSKSSTLPILQGILMEVKSNKLTLTSTNLEIGLSVTIPVKTEEEGIVLVQGDIFSKTIQSLTAQDKKVVISLEENTLKINTKDSTIAIKTLDSSEFPKLPKIEGNSIKIQKEVLVNGFKSTFFATSTTDIKPEIAAVYMYTEPNEIIFVGTDSFRLAEKKIKVKTNTEIKILVPNKNVQEIIKICESIEGDLELKYSETIMVLEGENIYITARLVDGVFPDYKRILPKESLVEVKVLKQDLIQNFKLSNLFSDSFNQCEMNVLGSENKITFTTKNQNIGEVKNDVKATVTGNDIKMNFNFKYIQETLQILEKESVIFSFTTEQKATVISQAGDSSYIYLVMPLNR